MQPLSPQEYLSESAQESKTAREAFLQSSSAKLISAAQMMGQCIMFGGKILVFGNGGSAADAQHMASELVGKLMVDRKPLAALALTTDSSALTALGNDFGYDFVFAKQVQALARPGDVVVAISTSGNSKNVVVAVEEARQIGCKVIALTGGDGGRLKSLCDISLQVSEGKNSCRIQETHIFAIHSLVDLMDRYFLGRSTGVT